MRRARAATVRVHLPASGDETLQDVQLALQLPQGWTALPTGPTDFTSVAPGTAPTATFQVTPPSYAPNASAVVHATATMGNMTREAGGNHAGAWLVREGRGGHALPRRARPARPSSPQCPASYSRAHPMLLMRNRAV